MPDSAQLTSDSSFSDAAVVVMAKPALPGRVKTRLIPALGTERAAAVHLAMLTCVLDRLTAYSPGPGRRVLAWADLADYPPPADLVPGWTVIDQGTGVLGDRLAHVWQTLGGGPVAFLGVDSPDIPAHALAAIPAALATADVAIGPAADGGYWTLAARRFQPALLTAIDWGTSAVYDQSLNAARLAKLSVCPLPTWYDVDGPADLDALLARLDNTDEPPLARLRERLRRTRENPG